MAMINYYQNSRNFEDRKATELRNTANHIQENINYQLNSGKYPDAATVIHEKIFEFSNVYNLNINAYNLQGKMVASNLAQTHNLKSNLIHQILKEKKVLQDTVLRDGKHKHYTAYTLLENHKNPELILELNNTELKGAASSQSWVLIKQYLFLVIFLLIACAFVAWLISKNLTKKLSRVTEKIKQTGIEDSGELVYEMNDEIKPLVDSYNEMRDKIAHQTKVLKKTEHAEAWKEMARQVAHEINKPLTPLRLTVQNFYRKYNPEDSDNNEKVKTLTKTIVHQIDIITAITKSFADFAKMPINKDTEIEIVDTIRKTINIFPQEIVNFTSNTEKLHYNIDALYLSRIITNIVKNGIQAIPKDRNKKIEVYLKDEPNSFLISVADNGSGISDDNKEKVFKTNFTTKSEGMGLGLSMVKKIVEDYGGKIWFESQPEYGTVFFIEFTKNNHAN